MARARWAPRGFVVALSLALSLLAAGLRANEDPLHLPIGDPARRDREAPLVLDAITDTATGTVLAPSEATARLASVRLLLIGETHTNMDSHRIEKRILEELSRAGRRVLVGLEMYPYTEQSWLDLWIGGRLSEKEFLDQSRWYRHWGYNWNYYREIFLLAGQLQIPLFAINTPREVITAVRKKGFQGLTEEEAAHVPARIDTESPEHLRLFKAALGEEGFHAGMSEEDWKSMFSAQCTWDATMAQNAVAALQRFEKDERAILVVFVGAGHVQYGLGIQRQAARSFSGKMASLIPVPIRDGKNRPVRTIRASYADFLWGVPAERDPLFPSLGVSTRDAEEGKGARVIHVKKKSVAEKAGLSVNDVVVSMDGAAIESREALNRLSAEKRWGDSARLSVRRGKDTLSLTVLFRREPPEESKPPDSPS